MARLTRRELLLTIAIAAGACRDTPQSATVTLTVAGRVGVGCIAAVRSALLEVPGVTRVQVTLKNKEAIVTYDPRTATVESLVAAVNQTEGPISPVQYRAEVKDGPRPVSAR